jgi:hypothetical protein
MGFLDDVRAEANVSPRPQNVCAVAKWLAEVDAETAAEFDAAMAHAFYASTVILKVMRDHGADFVSVTSVRRHRRSDCECHRRRAAGES